MFIGAREPGHKHASFGNAVVPIGCENGWQYEKYQERSDGQLPHP
jgi:hypothetical protein